ncbi:transposase, partial [Methanobrevibacter sp.]|uniref:transposase n=1 Tax=Methanobrevibacter sp. TaxID=66852 RepID=UPI00388F19B7
MSIISEIALESNKNIHVNFEGGNISSDAGMLLIKEFIHKFGLEKLAKEIFRTTDPGHIRFHKDHENLLQILFQIMGAYFQDDHADALRNDPAITAAADKETLASQPTLSRFHNRLDEKTLTQLEEMIRTIRRRVYSVKMPDHVLLDLDSTLFATFGKQEGGAFNFHYQANGYHPLICFDGMTGDLLKIELRPGTQYCCNGTAEFLRPLMKEFQECYPNIALFL